MGKDFIKIAEAVRKFFRDNDINQREFADKYGIDRSTLSNCLNAHRKFNHPIAVALNKEYGMDIAFILTGEGFLFRGLKASVTQVASHVTTNTQVAGPQTGADCSHCPVNALVEQLKDENKWLREQLSKH